MWQQLTDIQQQPTDEQNRINNKGAATTDRIGSTTDMPKQRINNRHARTTNKSGSTTDMPEQRTEPNQQQTYSKS
jgi:hypothetical protein